MFAEYTPWPLQAPFVANLAGPEALSVRRVAEEFGRLLGRPVTIRGEAHSVMQAINRQVAHYASHIGQIVYLAKHFRSAEWKSLSIPRGKSEEFLRRVETGKASQR